MPHNPSKKILYLLAIAILISFLAIGQNGTVRISKKAVYTMAALLLSVERETEFKLNIPFHRQEHSLSCEIATLKMALDYYKLDIPESELLEKLPFDTESRRNKNNTWGNPNLGFVGNIDGKMPNEGYGVYEKPIAKLASRYRRARSVENATLQEILTETAKGRPVIVWGAIGSGKDISWKTSGGQEIKAVFGEHTRIISGFSGTVSNPEKVYLLDPIYGQRVMSKEKFLADWALLDNKAVVVY